MSWLQRLFGSGEWSIHNELKGWTLHGLSAREGQLLVCTMSTAEFQLCQVWKRGWPRWEKISAAAGAELRAVREAEEGTALTRPADCPDLPAANPNGGEEITQVQMASSRQKDVYKREYDRWETRLAAEIILGNLSFKTHTDNVSEGGMRFVDPLPDWVAGYFTVVLQTPERPLEITCMLVEDQKGKKLRVEAVETNDEESHLPIYREWIRRSVGKN